MPYLLVLFIFSQVETARHRSRAITLRTHLFLLITHESAVLREVHSIEHSGLRIKKWEERGEHTALIQIIKRKPFSLSFFFFVVVVFRNELGPK